MDVQQHSQEPVGGPAPSSQTEPWGAELARRATDATIAADNRGMHWSAGINIAAFLGTPVVLVVFLVRGGVLHGLAAAGLWLGLFLVLMMINYAAGTTRQHAARRLDWFNDFWSLMSEAEGEAAECTLQAWLTEHPSDRDALPIRDLLGARVAHDPDSAKLARRRSGALQARWKREWEREIERDFRNGVLAKQVFVANRVVNPYVPVSKAAHRVPGGGLACPNCNGTQWKQTKTYGHQATNGADLARAIGTTAASIRVAATGLDVVECVTCGQHFGRG